MSTQCLVIKYAVAIFALVVVFSTCAQAGATRTFVSTTGNDSNTSANCGPLSPCRTFTAALSVTNAGGEIVVLTSGGYGPATISQPVIITAIGVDASISVTTSGANGLTINTPGNVTLIGLNLHGEGVGSNGIEVQQVGFLRLYNMLIENFTQGVDFDVSGNLFIDNSRINDTGIGIVVSNVSAPAAVHNTSFDGNGRGVLVNPGHATIVDSSAEYNFIAFIVATGSITLLNDRVTFNSTGLQTDVTGALYFANSLIANNTTAYHISSGTTMAGTSPGTSLIAPGQTLSGTLSTPITLQ
jgi:hypothetical protein